MYGMIFNIHIYRTMNTFLMMTTKKKEHILDIERDNKITHNYTIYILLTIL